MARIFRGRYRYEFDSGSTKTYFAIVIGEAAFRSMYSSTAALQLSSSLYPPLTITPLPNLGIHYDLAVICTQLTGLVVAHVSQESGHTAVTTFTV